MDKKEILAKGGQARGDAAPDRGLHAGIIAFVLVILGITLFNRCTHQPNDVPGAIFWAFVAAQSFPRYLCSKQKYLLLIAIAGTVLCLASLITYVMRVMG